MLKEYGDLLSLVLLDLRMPVMDDFGSGYSSLNMLADVPVDVLITICRL